MMEVQYGVVRINGQWVVIGHGLRFGSFDSKWEAETAAERLAGQSSGLPVSLHVQSEDGQLHRRAIEGRL